MSNLLELAERCEKERPSRGLDYKIGVANGMPENWQGFQVPAYTTSIDAALTLVPEGWAVLLAFSEQRSVCDVHTNPLGQEGTWPAHSAAATPALALCAAALRALAARESGS